MFDVSSTRSRWLRRGLMAVAILGIVGLGWSHAQRIDVALDGSPRSLDPHTASSGYALTVTSQIYETLIRFGPDGSLQPGLATSWRNVEPGVLRVELRSGVRFHDGTPLDAAAAAASFDRLLDPTTGSRGRFVVAMIDEIRVIDERTLEFRTDPPFVALPSHLTFPATAVVPVARAETLAREPVGSGPFRFVSWREGSQIVLAANADHWAGAPAVDGVRFRILQDPVVRRVELRTGGVDLLFDPTPTAFEALAERDDLEATAGISTRTVYVGFNLEHPVLGDVRVRRAIAHAIDKRTIAEAYMLGLAEPAASFLPRSVEFALDAAEPYPYDPDRARAMLDEAGHTDLRLELNVESGSDVESIGQLLNAMLADVGIDVTIRAESFAARYERIASGDAEIWLDFWDSITFDPDFTLWSFLHGSQIGANNLARYAEDEVDRLLERARGEDDRAAREQLWHGIQRSALDDLPYLPLVHPSALRVASAELRGVVAPGSSFLLDLRDAYFVPSEGASDDGSSD